MGVHVCYKAKILILKNADKWIPVLQECVKAERHHFDYFLSAMPSSYDYNYCCNSYYY